MAVQPEDLCLYTLTSPDDLNLPAVLALSNMIFSADGSTKHGSLTYWQDQLNHPSSFILYFALKTSPDHLVAFLFVIPRTTNPPLLNGATISLHIWLAAVLPNCRKAGCLARMVAQLDHGAQHTICTYPSRFPDMWNWLTRRGWIQERELHNGKVLFSRSPQS